jgi:RNA polymerase sigma-70 factor (ECF subfamily)
MTLSSILLDYSFVRVPEEIFASSNPGLGNTSLHGVRVSTRKYRNDAYQVNLSSQKAVHKRQMLQREDIFESSAMFHIHDETQHGQNHREDSEHLQRNEEFLRLFRENESALARFTRAMTRDKEAARDIAAETIVIALEQFHTIQNKQAFLSFLLTIASRLYKKRQAKLRFWGVFHEETLVNIPSTDAYRADLNADVQVLYAALARLPREQREAVVLFELNGLSLEEIQHIQGGTLSGVKSRLVRGRQKLAHILGVNNTTP